jgi:hypothetical protein
MSTITPLLTLIPAVVSAADPQQSVESGRESLDHWLRYPWYDSATDGVERVDVTPPYSWDWLWNWIPELFKGWSWNWAPFSSGFSWPTTLLGWIAWTLIAALFAALVWLLYRAWRRWAGEPDGTEEEGQAEEEEKDDRRRVEALPFPVQRRQGDLLEEARRCYDEGNYAEAIVYLFSHQLVQLDKHRLIRLAKGKTNRQYLREVSPRRPIARLLEHSMLVFEDVFFGNRPLDRSRFEGCWSRLDQFERLLAEAAP